MATSFDTAAARERFPSLPLDAWDATRKTLHRYTQVVGKVRLALAPRANHWWQVPLYVTSRGLTTGPIPYQEKTFAVDFDCIDHRLVITASTGEIESFSLEDGFSVASFYKQLFARLRLLGINVEILAKPYTLVPEIPFEQDTTHTSYQPEYVNRFWRVLAQSDQIFREFAGRFTGKTSPVHLFWHSFDLAMTRFSGRRAPDIGSNNPVEREAYSHEVVSFGFWAGDDTLRFPAYYSYTWPEPSNLAQQPLQPGGAYWYERGPNNHMALYKYDDARATASPRAALLEFLESAYQAGSRTAGWNVEEFTA